MVSYARSANLVIILLIHLQSIVKFIQYFNMFSSLQYGKCKSITNAIVTISESFLNISWFKLQQQFLSDGGHVSRNPQAALEILLDLLPLKHTYVNLGHDGPVKLISTIDRMFPILRFFRHSNGDLLMLARSSSYYLEWF